MAINNQTKICYICPAMTAYKHSVAVLTSPYDINEAKEKRKKQLQAVWERRKVIYERYTKKRQAAEQRYKQS